MALVKAEQVTGPWDGLNRLPTFKQIGLLVGLAASVAAGVSLWSWAQAPGYRVLYGSLDEQDASKVVETLQQQGIPYQVNETTGAIMVPGAEVHSARLKLAAAGLPHSGAVGFEGLGQQSGFGTSEFMETARYQRALEVELARSISTLANVKGARVHLAVPKQSNFVRKQGNPSASVILTLYSGRALEEAQVAAVTHLVASSVPNLDVGQVTVVDQKGNLLTSNDASRDIALTRTQFEYARKLEHSYISRIEGILTPILGADAVRAQVTADLDFTDNEQTQELFNPDTAALRSAQKVEEKSGGLDAAGIPGALSNQPPGPAKVPEVAKADATGASSNGTGSTRKNETNNYELDRTISHTRFAPGRIRRLSVAVVVDDRLTMESGGVVRAVRSPEELERIATLVKEAVGYTVQRGDRVNVVNAPFTAPAEIEPLPAVPFWQEPAMRDMAKQVLAALLFGILLLGVLRPVMKSLAKHAAETRAMVPAGAGGLQEDTLSLTGPGAQGQLGAPRPATGYEANMMRATQTVQQDPKLAAQVVKNWVASDE